MLAAILLGILVGMLAPEVGVSLKPLGDGFIKLVKMIIAPVIFLSIVTGIARSQELRGVGHITLKALAYFAFASTAALIVGLIVANVVRPGEGAQHRRCHPRRLEDFGLRRRCKSRDPD